jgi:hypothetical protein
MQQKHERISRLDRRREGLEEWNNYTRNEKPKETAGRTVGAGKK